MKNEIQVLVGSRTKVNPSDILMLKADTNYSNIYLVDGSILMSATTLGILEDRLKDFNFYRTHRSTLINLKYMAEIGKYNYDENFESIWIVNNMNIPVARRKMPDFLKTLQKINL